MQLGYFNLSIVYCTAVSLRYQVVKICNKRPILLLLHQVYYIAVLLLTSTTHHSDIEYVPYNWSYIHRSAAKCVSYWKRKFKYKAWVNTAGTVFRINIFKPTQQLRNTNSKLLPHYDLPRLAESGLAMKVIFTQCLWNFDGFFSPL